MQLLVYASRTPVAEASYDLAVLTLRRGSCSSTSSRQDVVRVLAEHSLQPHLLTIEVTENVALEDSSAVISTLHQLKASRVGIAVDDFGAGYSPLAQLSNIRPNLLKIDRSFISGLPDADSSLSVVRALVALAAGFDMSVTAEGIETVEQANILELLGCRRGQGFYCARPMSGEALIDYLETSSLEVGSAA